MVCGAVDGGFGEDVWGGGFVDWGGLLGSFGGKTFRRIVIYHVDSMISSFRAEAEDIFSIEIQD